RGGASAFKARACRCCAPNKPAICTFKSWSRRRKNSAGDSANCWANSNDCRPRTRSRKRRDSSARSRSSWGVPARLEQIAALPLHARPLPGGGGNRQLFRSVSPKMPLPALQLLEQKLEKQKRLFELRKDALERTIEQHIQLFEQRKGALERKLEHQFEAHKKKFEQKFDTQKKKIETRIRRFEQKNGIRLDDEVRFIRSWIEKPLTTGAVTPSGRALARTMAAYIDPSRPGPVIELGPGTGPVTAALLAQGIDP